MNKAHRYIKKSLAESHKKNMAYFKLLEKYTKGPEEIKGGIPSGLPFRLSEVKTNMQNKTSWLTLTFLILLTALLLEVISLYQRYMPETEFINHAQAQNIVWAEITAYTARSEECDSDPQIMASGKKVYPTAIACPAHLDFGTKIEIDGKEYTCEDRMSARYRHGNFFDILVGSVEEALTFGRQIKKIVIK